MRRPMTILLCPFSRLKRRPWAPFFNLRPFLAGCLRGRGFDVLGHFGRLSGCVLFLLFLGGGFVVGTSAQTAADTDPSARIFPYAYEMKDLPNGLRIIAIPTGFPNIVALQIPVSVGSRNEVEPGRSGFAHFFEHMMFRGTKLNPSEKYNAVLKAAGADQNAYTTDDYTNYHTTFAKEDLETIIALEADRFQNLDYPIEGFKTEALAVLGEYNKNVADPFEKLYEVLRDSAFEKHTYKHTTMGFLKDIEAMPEMYDYSRQFFSRYYRPERTTIILSGDIVPENVFALVEKYWGPWKRGGDVPAIPLEPEAKQAIRVHIPWEGETLPWVVVSFRGPASRDDRPDAAAIDLIAGLAFSESSPLYQRLVVAEQKIDDLMVYADDHVDQELVSVAARLKSIDDVGYVRDAIQATFAEVRAVGFEESRIADMKSHLRYSFASRLDNSESIAAVLVPYVARTRDPESLNRRYAQYAALDAKTLRDVASKYFVDRAMITTTLAHGAMPKGAEDIGSVDARVGRIAEDRPTGAVREILQHSSSPLVTVRLAFFAGAARDPEGAEGLAHLTAAALADGSSRRMSIEDIKKSMFPMAAELSYQVDQEMTVFYATVHKDNFDAFYALFAAQIFDPGLLEADFARVRDDLLNSIKIDLRANNDEELGKEALREMIYAGHPYAHLTRGRIGAIEKLTVADVRDFYRRFYTRGNALVAMAGDFSEAQAARVRNDLSKLGGEAVEPTIIPPVKRADGVRVRIIEKDTRATAISFGFPIEVTRSHPDFPALWLVRSYFGEHRSSNSFLFQKLREIRGLNYGDYAYIEYFPRGMFKFHPDPNLWRKNQIFEVWIRPVVPENGHFALRAAKFELDRLVKDGMTAHDFEETRSFLLKFMNVLTKTQDARLGYAMDSALYGIPEFTPYLAEKLKALKLEDVQAAIRKHLGKNSLDVVIVTKDAAGLRDRLVAGTPSPIRYESEKTAEILAEDKVISGYDLGISADRVEIVPLDKIFR